MKNPERNNETKETTGPVLSIRPKLSFEDYSSDINIGDLARILVHRGVLTIDDYELLIMRGHMIPRLKIMDDSNWQEIKAELLAFLDKKNWRSEGPAQGE